MGASKNLQRPVTHPSEGTHWLRILAGELAFRLQEAREENPGLWPRTLVLHVNEGGFFSYASFPFLFIIVILIQLINNLIVCSMEINSLKTNPLSFLPKPKHGLHRQDRRKTMG